MALNSHGSEHKHKSDRREERGGEAFDGLVADDAAARNERRELAAARGVTPLGLGFVDDLEPTVRLCELITGLGRQALDRIAPVPMRTE